MSFFSESNARASLPFAASYVRYPLRSKVSHMKCLILAKSSTTKMFLFIFEKIIYPKIPRNPPAKQHQYVSGDNKFTSGYRISLNERPVLKNESGALLVIP